MEQERQKPTPRNIDKDSGFDQQPYYGLRDDGKPEEVFPRSGAQGSDHGIAAPEQRDAIPGAFGKEREPDEVHWAERDRKSELAHGGTPVEKYVDSKPATGKPFKEQLSEFQKKHFLDKAQKDERMARLTTLHNALRSFFQLVFERYRLPSSSKNYSEDLDQLIKNINKAGNTAGEQLGALIATFNVASIPVNGPYQDSARGDRAYDRYYPASMIGSALAQIQGAPLGWLHFEESLPLEDAISYVRRVNESLQGLYNVSEKAINDYTENPHPNTTEDERRPVFEKLSPFPEIPVPKVLKMKSGRLVIAPETPLRRMAA